MNNENIAVLIPVKSSVEYNNKWVLSDLYLFFCKSFFKFYNDEHKYTIFIGYQDDDPLYSNKTQQDEIKRFMSVMKNTDVQMIKFTKKYKGNVVAIWNSLFDEAMRTETFYKYYIQCGSDIMFSGENFMNDAIKALEKNDGFGVVGLKDFGRYQINPDDKLLTQSIVSFRHYQIFGFYFPPEIINWGCDDWMTEIYEKHNMVYRLPQKFLNLGGKPRYKIDRNYEYNYKKCLKDYGNRIEEYKKFSGELINYF